MTSKTPCPLNGFTLVEILIALMMTATIMGSLFSVFTSSLDVAQQVENVARQDQMMRMVMDRLTRDLRSVMLLSASDMRVVDRNRHGTEGENAISGNGAQSPIAFPGFNGYAVKGMEDLGKGLVLMSFPSMSSLEFRPAFPILRINQIKYVLRRQGNGNKTYVLYRQELPFAGLYSEGTADVELADGIVLKEDSLPQYIDETGAVSSAWDASKREEDGTPVVPRLITWMFTVSDGHDLSRKYALVVHPQIQGMGK